MREFINSNSKVSSVNLFGVKLAESVYQFGGKDKKAGNIFTHEAQKNKKLIAAYNNFAKAKEDNRVSDKEKQKLANIFSSEFAKADLQDNGKFDCSNIDPSIRKNLQTIMFSSQDFSKKPAASATNNSNIEGLLESLEQYDKMDDGETNGSIINNPLIRMMLDKMDDGEINGSIDEYIKFLQEGKYDNKEIYNIFGLQSAEMQNKAFGNNYRPEVSYNSNNFSGYGFPKNSTVNPDSIISEGTAANAAKIALGEIGKNESDGSYHKYTNGRNESWCTDFVNWSFKQANGGKTPWGENFTSVQQLMNWGITNNKFSKQKDGNGVKVGDIAIFKDNGRSHTGIVTKVDQNGIIHTIEGNTSNKVAERQYKPGDSHLTGFVKMSDTKAA